MIDPFSDSAGEPVTAPIGGWRTATVAEVEHPGPRAVVLRLDVPDRVDHWAGQHYVVRLRAPDGYVAARSYSIASAPGSQFVELYVERLEDGEVSGFLADVVVPGDQLEVRGPIGGWFVWRSDRPALLIGGGSGVVPLVSMIRLALRSGSADLLRMAVSARSFTDLPYAPELVAAGATVALSRRPDSRVHRPAGRLTAADLMPLVRPSMRVLVCGSAVFASGVEDLLQSVSVPNAAVRVERFGPSGDSSA